MTPTGLVGKGDPYAQTIQTLKTIEAALAQAGASMADVVRTRIYMADIEQWQEVGRAHGEVFGAIRPATTMVEVKRLIDPDMLVEIEADAITVRGGPSSVSVRGGADEQTFARNEASIQDRSGHEAQNSKDVWRQGER